MPLQSLARLPEMEDEIVKYAMGADDLSVMATLVPSKEFEDEMEIRFSIMETHERFCVRGHKSIMDKMSFEDFEKKVQYHLKGREAN